MKLLTLFFVFIFLFAINSKVMGENKNHTKWIEQRERRKYLTTITAYNSIQTKSIKYKCIQGKRLNDLYAISFWSFIAHDSRLEDNWEEAKLMLGKFDEKIRNEILSDKDEMLMLQGAYEAGLLLAMRETCPNVW